MVVSKVVVPRKTWIDDITTCMCTTLGLSLLPTSEERLQQKSTSENIISLSVELGVCPMLVFEIGHASEYFQAGKITTDEFYTDAV